jgi:hypothetical protein
MTPNLVRKVYVPVLLGFVIAVIFFLACYLVPFALSNQESGAFIFVDCFCMVLVFGLIIPELRQSDSVTY